MSSLKKKQEEPEAKGRKRARYETIDDLPPEMLMEILKCLPTSTLVSSCCLVNRKWAKISSFLLRYRPETLLKFFLGSGGSYLRSEIPNQAKGDTEELLYGSYMAEEQKNTQYRTLEDFVECYKTSKNFPFTCFSIKDFYKGGNDLTSFLTTIGSKILSIKIIPPETESDVKLLRELLTKHCPELQELIFDDFRRIESKISYSENLKLFTEEDKNNLLPNLKIFHLNSSYKKCLGVVEDILKAASSLKEIRGEWIAIQDSWVASHPSIKVEDIELLSKFGKLHLIESATLKGDELVGHWNKFPAQMIRLSKLKIDPADTNINTLIEYSKDTLKELVIQKHGYAVANVNWSLIPNLQKLSLPANENPRIIFPVGKDIILPNLQELEIENTGEKSKTSTAKRVSFPSVKILKLQFDSYHWKSIRDICVMFPNVTCLDLTTVKNFSDIGEIIWKNMKQLMTLGVYIPKNELDFDADDEEREEYWNNPYEFSTELDSCFTGYSEDTCIDLKDKFEGKTEVSEEELLQLDRDSRSIIDLKYLTTLILKCDIFQCYCVPLPKIKKDRKEKVQLFKDGISCVSRLFAFQQMPNLQIKIEFEVTDDC